MSSQRRGGSRLSRAAAARFLKVQRTHTHANTHTHTHGRLGIEKRKGEIEKDLSFPYAMLNEESSDEECR